MHISLDRPERQHLFLADIKVRHVEIEVGLLGSTVRPTRRGVVRVELETNVGTARDLKPDPIIGGGLLIDLAATN